MNVQKTVLIYDQLGQDELKFLVVEGDYRHLHGVYSNSTKTTKEQEDQINTLVFNEEWYLKDGFVTEFPTQAVIDGAYVVTIGFLP